jgi:uncharacterized protein (UPF0248 family)
MIPKFSPTILNLQNLVLSLLKINFKFEAMVSYKLKPAMKYGYDGSTKLYHAILPFHSCYNPTPKPSSTPAKTAPIRQTTYLRPARDVLNRILWDNVYDTSEYEIGYVDRFDGVLEISVSEWKRLREHIDEEVFIPLHRIVYFRHITTNVKVWDRKSREECVFTPVNGGGCARGYHGAKCYKRGMK